MLRNLRHASSRRPTALLTAVVASVALGCGVPPAPAAPTSLRDAKPPRDFTLSTSRNVSVGLTADDAVFGGKPDTTLVLSRPNGAAIFRGVLKKGAELEVTLPMAVDLDSIDVRVGAGDGVRRFNFPVDSDTKSLSGHIR